MPEDAVIRKYLLGEATEDAAASVETAYFSIEQALDEVGSAEWDLLDDYLAGRLPAGDRARFERHYLRTPAHRRRLAMAKALAVEAAAQRRPHKVLYFLPLAAAAILVLTVVAVVWGLRLPEAAHVPGASIVSVQLPLVAVRGEGETPTAHLGVAAALELRLEPGAATAPYALLLRTVEGREVWRGEAADQPVFRIPAAELAAGDYVAELTSGTDAPPQRYYVRLLRP
jgi:hypothetical protein